MSVYFEGGGGNHNFSGLSSKAEKHPSNVFTWMCKCFTWQQVDRVVDLSMKTLGILKSCLSYQQSKQMCYNVLAFKGVVTMGPPFSFHLDTFEGSSMFPISVGKRSEGGGVTGNLLFDGIGFKFTVRDKYPVLCRRKCK